MAKGRVILMEVTSTGIRKVGESPNGGGPAPVKFCGQEVGVTHRFSKTGKSVKNKQLHQAGCLGTTMRSGDRWVTKWTREDGVAITAKHYAGFSDFSRTA